MWILFSRIYQNLLVKNEPKSAAKSDWEPSTRLDRAYTQFQVSASLVRAILCKGALPLAVCDWIRAYKRALGKKELCENFITENCSGAETERE